MPLTPKRIRIILRWVHIVLGLVILCYIYSPLHQFLTFQIIVKFVVIPIIVSTGIWLWKFQQFNKIFGIRS